MNTDLYDFIFKRRSFHLFRGVGDGVITEEELAGIREAFEGFGRLCPDIRTAIRIVPSDKARFKRDAEYCILLYSEEKENYLQNAGYIGEQLDLYLTGQDIGSLWYGLGKPDLDEYDGLRFVIMFAIRKVNDPSLFRRDMFKAKRKPLSEIWSGDDYGVGEIARFAPSAVNSQPWRIESRDGVLTVSRFRKPGRIGLLPSSAASYFNRIDIGIFLCFLELCLGKKGISFSRGLFADDGSEDKAKFAEYTLRF